MTSSSPVAVGTPDKTITIMPDYGHSPYAWVKDSSDITSYVGLNAGGYLSKPSEFPISDSLHDEFCAWGFEFEVGADKPEFDWAAFHKKGLLLTRELKRQVGSSFNVLYVKPFEDSKSDCPDSQEIV